MKIHFNLSSGFVILRRTEVTIIKLRSSLYLLYLLGNVQGQDELLKVNTSTFIIVKYSKESFNEERCLIAEYFLQEKTVLYCRELPNLCLFESLKVCNRLTTFIWESSQYIDWTLMTRKITCESSRNFFFVMRPSGQTNMKLEYWALISHSDSWVLLSRLETCSSQWIESDSQASVSVQSCSPAAPQVLELSQPRLRSGQGNSSWSPCLDCQQNFSFISQEI